MKTSEVREITGLTDRQVNYWLEIYEGAPAVGSGNHRDLTDLQVQIIRLYGSLVSAGFTTPAADTISRMLVERTQPLYVRLPGDWVLMAPALGSPLLKGSDRVAPI